MLHSPRLAAAVSCRSGRQPVRGVARLPTQATRLNIRNRQRENGTSHTHARAERTRRNDECESATDWDCFIRIRICRRAPLSRAQHHKQAGTRESSSDAHGRHQPSLVSPCHFSSPVLRYHAFEFHSHFETEKWQPAAHADEMRQAASQRQL